MEKILSTNEKSRKQRNAVADDANGSELLEKIINDELFSELDEWAMDKEQVREVLIEWETQSTNRVLYEARAKE